MVAGKTQEFFFTLNKNSPNGSQLMDSVQRSVVDFKTLTQPSVEIMNKTLKSKFKKGNIGDKMNQSFRSNDTSS